MCNVSRPFTHYLYLVICMIRVYTYLVLVTCAHMTCIICMYCCCIYHILTDHRPCLGCLGCLGAATSSSIPSCNIIYYGYHHAAVRTQDGSECQCKQSPSPRSKWKYMPIVVVLLQSTAGSREEGGREEQSYLLYQIKINKKSYKSYLVPGTAAVLPCISVAAAVLRHHTRPHNTTTPL